MKLYIVSAVVAVAAFAAYTGIQLHLQQPSAPAENVQPVAAVVPVEKPKKVKRLSFPSDLAPAAKGKAVPEAAEFVPADRPHKLALLKPSGGLHPWHEEVHDDWQANSVEKAELVLVVGKQTKTAVQHITYANNAPPITRYEFVLEVQVVEAKTGHLLATQRFRTVPRPVLSTEAWATTMLGRPVSLPAVFRWVSRLARIGFPDELDSMPIVIQSES